MKINIAICILLLVATGAVYRQVSGHQFVNFDDGKYITENYVVQGGLTGEGVRWAFTTVHASNWHPLAWLSHMLDVQLFGLHAGAHHLVNVLFHAANAVLLFLVLLQMTGARWPSAFVAALFALHPLHVESVAWVAERKDILSALFWMITMLSYAWYVRRPGRTRYLLTLCAFALGLMSKPMLVTLPFVLLLMDYWPLGRLRFRRIAYRSFPPDPGRPAGDGVSRSAVIKEKIPFIALSVVSGIITLYAQQHGGAVASIKSVPFAFRAVNALVAYAAYLGKTFWPLHLAVIYPLPPVLTLVQGAVAGSIVAGITALAVRSVRRHPYVLTGWLWFLGTLVPVIGLVQVGRQSMADRYTYIPLIGIFIIIAWGLHSAVRNSRIRRIAASVAAGLALTVLAALTWVQTGYWKDGITLFRHAAVTVFDNFIAHEGLAYALAKKDRLDEANYHYSEALRISPDYELALTGISNVLVRQGKIEAAVRYADKALRLYPDSAEAQFSMGYIRLKQGRDEEALAHYREGLPKDPSNAEIHYIVGVILGSRGELDESIEQFTEALRLQPDNAEAHYGLGVALVRKGAFDDGISQFTRALRIKPGFEKARLSLNDALRRREKAPGIRY